MKDYHVMPSWEPWHECSEECQCCPKIYYQDPVNGNRVWLHNEVKNGN